MSAKCSREESAPPRPAADFLVDRVGLVERADAADAADPGSFRRQEGKELIQVGGGNGLEVKRLVFALDALVDGDGSSPVPSAGAGDPLDGLDFRDFQQPVQVAQCLRSIEVVDASIHVSAFADDAGDKDVLEHPV